MQSVVFIYFLGLVLIPTIYFVGGGLIGKTYEKLCRALPGNRVDWVFGLLFWPALIVVAFLCVLFGLFYEAITYPAKRNSRLKEREAVVERLLTYDDYHGRNKYTLRDKGIDDNKRQLLASLPWREAEAYLKRKGVL